MRITALFALMVLIGGPLSLPLSAQAALSAEQIAQMRPLANNITGACQMTTLTDAQITCLYDGGQQAFAACVAGRQTGTLIEKISFCFYQGVAQAPSLLSTCIQGITDAQKSCAITKAGEAAAAFNAAVARVAGGTPPPAVSTAGMAAGDFVPLTNIPGIAEAAQSKDLSGLLNTIYKLCIGIAAVLAVVQILRGGLTYMLGDSITEKREARHHIYMAVFGLLLVLSPAIVFGIIDRRILDLKIDVGGLTWQQQADILLENGQQQTDTTDQSPIILEGTCTNPSWLQTMQASLDAHRANNPTGTARLEIQPYGQAGIGCCNAVRDNDGGTCRGSSSQSFTRNDTLIINYSCTCESRGPGGGTGKWGASEVTVTIDIPDDAFFIDSEADSIRQSGSHILSIGPNANPHLYDTEAQCESIVGYSQAMLHSSLKNNTYVCPETGGGWCSKRVNWVKGRNAADLPAGVLTLTARACRQD